MEPGETRNLSDYLGVLRRRIWLVVGITLIAGGIALAFSLVRTSVYEASTSLTFDDPAQQAGGVLGGSSLNFFPQREAAAGGKIMTRPDVLKQASRDLGGDPTADELEEDTTVEVDQITNIVTAKVKADEAEQAAREANALATAAQTLTRDEARAFYEERARSLGGGDASDFVRARLKTLAAVAEPVSIVSPAEVPDSRISPKPVRDVGIALFLGLLIGVAAAFIRESLD